MKFFFTLLFTLLFCTISSQNKKVDSLLHLLNIEKDDKKKIDIYILLTTKYWNIDFAKTKENL